MKLPSKQECKRILSACGTPEDAVRHSFAVAEYAVSLAKQLNAAGCALNESALYAAALLHDCRRAEPYHAKAAADYLSSLGYKEVADVVALHHDLDEPMVLDEAAVLYYADKRVKGDRLVPLKERYSASLAKCADETAKAAHKRRLTAALAVEKLIAEALGTTDF